jgi:molybdopterin-guanine dinucleotide biosynthesis protein A
MGGSKAARPLAGRPLAAHAAAALAGVCERVALVCKSGGGVPEWGWELWDDEPAEPRHPAAGIAYALERAGEAVLVCAADMPFVRAEECARLAGAHAGAPDAAVVAARDGTLEPLLAVYLPSHAAPLRAAADRGDALRAAVERLRPVRVELPAAALRSVDTPAALAAAEAELASRAPGSP